MKLVSITGGATKFLQLLIAFHLLLKRGYKPTDIIVTSASALFILPYLLGKADEMFYEGRNLDLKKYFVHPPTDGNGNLTFWAKLRAIWSFMPNWIPGGNIDSFGVQDVRPLLKKYLSDEEIKAYVDGDYPNVHVLMFCPSLGRIRVVNIKDPNLTVDEIRDIIEASTRLQGLTNPLYIGEVAHVDGGMFLSGAAGFLMENEIFQNVYELVSIYSYTNPFPKENHAWKENIGNNAMRISFQFESAVRYLCPMHEHWYCVANDIPRLEIRVPDILQSTYDVDAETIARASRETNIHVADLLNRQQVVKFAE